MREAGVSGSSDSDLLRKVDELGLSVRAANCLRNENVTYVAELVQKSEAELLRTRNFGRKSLNEIKEVLAQMGLHLGMVILNWPRDNDLQRLPDNLQVLPVPVQNTLVQTVQSLPEDIRLRLARRISDVDFSPRTHHALAAARIVFVGDLVH